MGLVRYAAIDTGSSRNATVLVIGEDRVTAEHPPERPLWAITGLWRWQGSTGKPLDHRAVIGPIVFDLLRARGITRLAADGYERGPLLNAFLAKSEELAKTGSTFDVSLTIQGGELGPSPDGKSIGVYGHGRRVVHDRRLVVELDDEDEVSELVRGLQAIQCEEGRVWLPADGASHYDSTAAVLRLLWHACAGIETTPLDLGPTNAEMPCYGEAGQAQAATGDGSADFAPNW